MREAGEDERRIELPWYERGGERCPEVLLEGPEIAELADLFTMRFDLDHVIDLCALSVALPSNKMLNAADTTLGIRTTWEAAVIAYGRAFVSGVSAHGGGGRTRFPSAILDGLTDEQRAVHKRTLTLRQKHVGHRVNNWTQVIVTAVLAPESDEPRRVLEVGQKLLTAVGGAGSAEQLRQLALVLRDGINERIAAIEADIMSQLAAESIDDLYAAAAADAEHGKQQMELERQRREAAAATRAEVVDAADPS